MTIYSYYYGKENDLVFIQLLYVLVVTIL